VKNSRRRSENKRTAVLIKGLLQNMKNRMRLSANQESIIIGVNKND